MRSNLAWIKPLVPSTKLILMARHSSPFQAQNSAKSAGRKGKKSWEALVCCFQPNQYYLAPFLQPLKIGNEKILGIFSIGCIEMGLYDNETIWRHIQNDYCFMFKMALQLTTRMHTILQHSDSNRLKNYILSIKNHHRAIGDIIVHPLLSIMIGSNG